MNFAITDLSFSMFTVCPEAEAKRSRVTSGATHKLPGRHRKHTRSDKENWKEPDR